MDTVEFQLNLQDQMTAALRSGADAADKLDHNLEKATGSLQKHEKAEKEAASATAKFHEHLENVVARFFEFEALEKVTELISEFGKKLVESTVEITDFDTKAEIALHHLYGNSKEAMAQTEDMIGQSHRFANDAGLPVEKVTEAFLGLKRAGLDDSWVRPLTAAAGDLAGLSGHPENFHAITEEFEQIALKGELSGRALISLQRDGINTAALAARFGAKDFHALQEQLSKHPVEATRALREIEEVIKETAHEDFLGQVTKEMADGTFGGSITRIKNAWTEMIETFNSDPAFKEMRADFSELASDIIEHLPTWEKQFTAAFDPALKALDEFIKNPTAIKSVIDAGLGAAEKLGIIFEKLFGIMQWMSRDFVFDLKHGLHTEEHQEGHGSLKEFVFGSKRQQEVDRLTDAGFDQKAAEKMARKTGEGAASSFDTGGPVNETGPANVHEGEHVIPVGGSLVMREGSRGSSGGSGSGAVVHAPIHVEVKIDGGGHALTEHGLKLLLEEMLPSALVSPFEKLAATVGAS